jgi:hypothetical protein
MQTGGTLSQRATCTFVCWAECTMVEDTMGSTARAQLVRDQEQMLHEIEHSAVH